MKGVQSGGCVDGLNRALCVVVLGLVCVGCDVFRVDSGDMDGTRMHVIFTSADHKALIGGCASSIETAVLNVNGREFREDVTGDTVEFEISGIPQGDVFAQATILSNTGDTLFAGEDRRTIRVSDFGTIDLDVEKLRPVLIVCPDTLTLYEEQRYVAALAVVNKGARATGSAADTLRWWVDEESICEGAACVAVRPASGFTVAPDSAFPLVVGTQTAPNAGLDLPVRSSFGVATVRIRIRDVQ